MDLWRLPLTASGRAFVLMVTISKRDRDKYESELCRSITADCRAACDALLLTFSEWMTLMDEVDQWAINYATDNDDRKTAASLAAAVQNMLNKPPHDRRESVAKPQPVKLTQMNLI